MNSFSLPHGFSLTFADEAVDVEVFLLHLQHFSRAGLLAGVACDGCT